MKTITEFDGFRLKNALETKKQLVSAGKTAEELPAAMGEALKLEGDKLALMLKALDIAEKRLDGLKRILVGGVEEGKAPPKDAIQIEDKLFIAEFFYVPQPRQERGRGEGRDGGRGKGRGKGRGGRDGKRGGGGGRGDSRSRDGRNPRGEGAKPHDSQQNAGAPGAPGEGGDKNRRPRRRRPPRGPRDPNAQPRSGGPGDDRRPHDAAKPAAASGVPPVKPLVKPLEKAPAPQKTETSSEPASS